MGHGSYQPGPPFPQVPGESRVPKRSKVALVVAIACSFFAAIVCYYLLGQHVGGDAGPSWFASACADDTAADGGGANCAAVLASPYSYFPARTSDESDGKPRVPVAFLGMVYYSCLFVWLVCIGVPDRERAIFHWVPLFVVGLGLAGSAYYIRIMFTHIDEWCPWCMVTHGLNLIIAVCLIVMWPKLKRKSKGEPAQAAPPKSGVKASGEPRGLPHPTTRVVGVCVLALVATAYGELNMLGLKTFKKAATSNKKNFHLCYTEMQKLLGNSERIYRAFMENEPRDIPLRDHDPSRGAKDAPVHLVIFSDFECPGCKRFETYLKETIEPFLEGNLRVTFKHYPLDSKCNAKTRTTMHPKACLAAKLADAAGNAGGEAAFWKAHDYLFEHQDALKKGEIDASSMAKELGVSGPLPLDSAETQEQISEDIEDAAKLGIRATPTIFLNGRPVPGQAALSDGFWKVVSQKLAGKGLTPTSE